MIPQRCGGRTTLPEGARLIPKSGSEESEGTGTRTLDLRIKSPLLYQLSYALNHPKTWGKAPIGFQIVTLYQDYGR